MNEKQLTALMKIAYRKGFRASREGYNEEYPFEQDGISPNDWPKWMADRDKAVKETVDIVRASSWLSKKEGD